jgi:hypothetical protein
MNKKTGKGSANSVLSQEKFYILKRINELREEYNFLKTEFDDLLKNLKLRIKKRRNEIQNFNNNNLMDLKEDMDKKMEEINRLQELLQQY